MTAQSYHRPPTAAALYAAMEGETAPVLWLAGGTDVLVQARGSDAFAGRAVCDLSAMAELKAIREEGDSLLVGSGATFTALMTDPLVARHAPLLAQAAAQVGAVQLRNRATVGGNVANASPAGDSFGPLAALDATVLLDEMGRQRELPFTEFILAPGKTALGEREFIRAFRLPKLAPAARAVFYKVGRRNALAISRLTLSIIGMPDGAGGLGGLRIAVGAVFPRPMRFADVEALAEGRPLTDELIDEIADAMAEKIPEIAGRRASTVYKQPVCRMALARLLREMRDEHEN